MKISSKNLARLERAGAVVNRPIQPKPAEPPPPPPLSQEDVARIVAEALAASSAASSGKALSFRFEILRDTTGRIASITAHPINP